MFKSIVAATVMLGLGVAGIELASAETPAPPGDSTSANKTSDRTPGNATPDRTEGASTSGAAGTDAAQTSQGTSDRTPANQPAGSAANPALRGNLFTEEQARTHLARAGYVNISGLTKDENGAWRGAAVKDGKTIMVGIDVKGNVAAN